MSKKPAVRITNMLRESLEAEGYDVGDFCDLFADWKTGWPAQEYTDWFFGKDGEYVAPTRNHRRVLRHVHLPPEAKAAELNQWNHDFSKKTRKTSDTSLVYAEDAAHGYLLIYVAREPVGHDLAAMKTSQTLQLMNIFADQAEKFIFEGAVYL